MQNCPHSHLALFSVCKARYIERLSLIEAKALIFVWLKIADIFFIYFYSSKLNLYLTLFLNGTYHHALNKVFLNKGINNENRNNRYN